ncbi:RNA polymerase factor sigma-54 [Acidimangrovimonas sediminis]|uniref:RNA polymerase factor sigma-54 n=1 Tax=Acidimangrovimonas sediminis TaxID=2056283 RepID=UPI000C7FEC65|nr:RNA polymerase factor sigma-54 [Acidimangrovimonas sediminis]
MAVTQRLGIAQQPGLALTPGMRQSLQILAMPPLDLAQVIAREAGSNPFLRVTPPSRGGLSAYDIALETVAARPSLGEGLRRQLGQMSLPGDVHAVAIYLTGALRDDGYLDATDAELIEETGQPAELVAEAIAALQRCEPAGVGARDLAECLALQLADKGVAPDLAAQVVAHLDLFAQDDWTALSRRLGVPVTEVKALDAALRSVSPHPVDGGETSAMPLVPDLVVDRGPDGGLAVRLAEGVMPALRLDSALLARVPDVHDPFVAAARARAEALIRAVGQRGETLLRIGGRLVADQHLFFTRGPENLAPLSRRKLADELGLHPSTLGRAVAGKVLMSGGALYPLSLFFPSGLPAGRGGRVSSHAVKIAIRRMVEHEPATTPLSDAAIRARLNADGIDITRRCVAKYRESMRIPSSFERRRRARDHKGPAADHGLKG